MNGVRFAYLIALIGYFGLFALLMLLPTVLSPQPKQPVALILLITVSPLLLPLHGVLDGNPKSCAWLAYISLVYFTHSSVEAYANEAGRSFALLEVLLSLMIFFGATFYIRLSKAQQ